MTEKRFIKPYQDCRIIKNIQTDETATYFDTEDGLMFLKWLNNLSEENEQLKSEYKVLHTQHQDLRKFVENNFDEHLTREKLNRQIIKLSDENERLKKENQELEKFQYQVFEQIDKAMKNKR